MGLGGKRAGTIQTTDGSLSDEILAETTQTTEGSLLEEVLAEIKIKPTDEGYDVARRGVEAFVAQMLAPNRAAERVDKAIVDAMIAEIDVRLSAQVNEILHHPEFQKLESAWRSLKYVIDTVDFRENVRVEVLNCSKDDLLLDFEDSPEIANSGLYRIVYSNVYSVFGGKPYGVIAGQYDFGPGPKDILLLRKCAAVAAMSHAPFIANAAPEMFGGKDFLGLPNLSDVKSLFEESRYAHWHSFRSSTESRFVGLCMPRFLLRPPYGEKTVPVKSFNFNEEVIGNHKAYLWGYANNALVTRIADSFAKYRWCPNIIGWQAGGAVRNLPLREYQAMGENQTKVPTEVVIAPRREPELSAAGFIAFSALPEGSGDACFLSANSVHADRVLEAQLPYAFMISRAAQYVRVVHRDGVTPQLQRRDIQNELNRWLSQYVAHSGADAFSDSPFHAARVVVSEPRTSGERDSHVFHIHLRPNFGRLSTGVPVSLHASGKLDAPTTSPAEALGSAPGFTRAIAGGGAGAAGWGGRGGDEGTTITRFPSIASNGRVIAGCPIIVVVDLLLRDDWQTTGEAVGIAGLPDGWNSFPVVVRVSASNTEFGEGRDHGVVLVRRNEPSIPCTLVGMVAAEATSVEIVATFFYNDRYSGEARRQFRIEGIPSTSEVSSGVAPPYGEGVPPSEELGAPTRTPAWVPESRAPTGLAIMPSAEAPDLTIRVWRYQDDTEDLLRWHLDVPRRLHSIAGLPPDLRGESRVGGRPTRWALDLLDVFANNTSASHMPILNGIGDKLYESTPECFRKTYGAVQRALGDAFSIQLICDDPFVPWELLRPQIDGRAGTHLYLSHPIARWLPTHETSLRRTIPPGRVVTVAATYRDGRATPVPAAVAQVDVFRRRLNATSVAAEHDDVLALLEDADRKSVSLLYFAGHGRLPDSQNLDASAILLEDQDLHPPEVCRAETTLGVHSGTFVFFNACNVGTAQRTLGSPGGWPGAFIGRGFRGFLAPISRVWERDAAQFAEAFIERVLEKKMPVGEALRDIRRALGSTSPTPLAYIYYGDVMTRFE